MECKHDGCQKKANVVGGAKGFCAKHYQRFKKYGSSHFSKYDRESKHTLCTVDGCERTHHAKGFCDLHWGRFYKGGSPHHLHPMHRRKISWIEDNASYAGDDCLKWPFGVSSHGRGTVNLNKKHMSAPRAMCIIANGAPPTPKHQAAHTCGNGHLGCMNPKHLEWKTAKQNEADKVAHGTLRKGTKINTSKLTEDDVLSIRKLLGDGHRGVDVAKKYDVTPACICSIKFRKSWAWLP